MRLNRTLKSLHQPLESLQNLQFCKQNGLTTSARRAYDAQQRIGMKVAVEGCCHGDLDRIYATMQELERRQRTKIDLLICCGDFQAVRNLDDLECLACPVKYRHVKTFYKYYSGELKAPYLTIFIGGNHEACNHLWELYYGGWVAPNIYYMGHAGVVNIGGLRIGGLSGIFNKRHYKWGHHEKPPYSKDTMRSAYHVRELEVFRLLQLRTPLDIMLSHDWPDGIAYHGDINGLFRSKPFLKDDIESGELGSPPAMGMLKELRPRYWFSAHHHVKYAATVRHASQQAGATGGGEDPLFANTMTDFLALDKCLPKRKFLQIVDFPKAQGPLELSYDPEWLAILSRTHGLLSLGQRAKPLPGMGGARNVVTQEALAKVQEALQRQGGPSIPHNFQPTAAAHDPSVKQKGRMPQTQLKSPQTLAFLDMLGLPYNLESQDAERPATVAGAPGPNPEEIELGEEEEENPEEIDLEDEVDSGEDA